MAAGRVLTRLGLVVHRLGDPRSEELLAEARAVLETQPPGPELVSAYAYLAGRYAITSRYPQAVAAGERALALAKELGLSEPPFAFNFRGYARCELGEAEGVEDMRRALQLALEQAQGREAGVIYGYLTWTGWAYQGPQAALDVCAEGVAFCERRGITEVALQLRSGRPATLAALGQTEQALAEAGPLADRLQAAGDIAFIESRTVQLWLHAERGTPQQAPAHDELLTTARDMRLVTETTALFMAAAHLLLARGEPEQARALLHELDELQAVRSEFDYGLASPVRLALALDDESLACRLTTGIEPVTPLSAHVLATAQAQLAEAAGDHVQAASLYADAADGWRKFGNVPERAYALLGQGRCLLALSDAGAEVQLTEARDLFRSIGYEPALAETEKLLAHAAAPAS